jgi:hypothetical protein
MTDQIKQLHRCWCDLTGQDLNLRATERLFYELLNSDFTVDDLGCVVRYVLAFNRKHLDCPMKVQFHRICGDLEQFASVLAEARAKERNRIKPLTARASVVQAFRPVADVEGSATGNSHRIGEFLQVPKI